LFNARFNTEFIVEDKVTLEFSIILSLILIISSNAEFNKQHNDHTSLSS